MAERRAKEKPPQTQEIEAAFPDNGNAITGDGHRRTRLYRVPTLHKFFNSSKLPIYGGSKYPRFSCPRT